MNYTENTEIKYTTFDFLQKRHDIAKIMYDNMLDDIHELWDNVMLPYLTDDMVQCNGFLQKIKNNLTKGQQKFFDFILKNSDTAKLVEKEYYNSLNCLHKFMKENLDKCIQDSIYFYDKIDDNIEIIKKNHIDLLKEAYVNKWNFEKEIIVNELYDYF